MGPKLQRKLAFAGTAASSFEVAAWMIRELAEMDVPAKRVERQTEARGREAVRMRAEAVEAWEAKAAAPEVGEAPAAAVISTDGGRMRTRAHPSSPGVHDPKWRETKVATLTTLASEEHTEDPHPEAPSEFLDERHVCALVAGLQGSARGGRPEEEGGAKEAMRREKAHEAKAEGEEEEEEEKVEGGRPRALVQTMVATVADVEGFGAQVAAEAHRRRVDEAGRLGFVADGQASNWTVWEMHFPQALPLLDFPHLVSHLFGAARAAFGRGKRAWNLYVKLVTAAWSGQADEVERLLRAESRRLGEAPEDAPENDPRVVVSRAAKYVKDNRDRMDYPGARRLGLPVASGAVESGINRLAQRVKACGKFWSEPGGESVLALRARLLSDDPSWERFWEKRASWLASRKRPYAKRRPRAA